jgi:hypothetical protein
MYLSIMATQSTPPGSPYRWTAEKKEFIRERLNENRAKVKKDFTARFGRIDVEIFQGMFTQLRPSTGRRSHAYTEEQTEWLQANPELAFSQLEPRFKRAFPNTNVKGTALAMQRRRLLDPNRNNIFIWDDDKVLYMLKKMGSPIKTVAQYFGISNDEVSKQRYLLKIEFGEDIAGAIRTKEVALNSQINTPTSSRRGGQPTALENLDQNTAIQKTQTGIAAELLVAGELSRRGFNVAITFGNTKAIDLIVDKAGRMVAVQVKGIQKKASICWNVKLEKIKQFKRDRTYDKVVYVLVNLNADSLAQPEYFILSTQEMIKHVKPVASGRDYLDYNVVKRLRFKDQWQKI